jgi:ADP-L-glycero-D-manno-heptose 6-epimerase
MIIVTGGAGFIGSALIWKLNKISFDDILVVDCLGKDDKWKNLRPLKFRDYIEKDAFRQLAASEKTCASKKIDAVFHFGACSSTTEADASFLMDNNYEYSKELATFCAKRKIKFIYASSAATYGDGSRGWSDDETKIERLLPLNIYGYSKHAFDLWMKRNGLLKKSTGLKFTNVFGPNEWHKGDMRSLVCKALEQVRQTGRIRLFKSYKKGYADGEQKRDFLYVKDAVNMCVHALEKNISGIYNIGSGKAESWNSLAGAIFAALDKKNNIEFFDMPEEIKDKYQYYTCAEMKKFLSTGYKKQFTPLKDAVKDYVLNHLIKSKHLGE